MKKTRAVFGIFCLALSSLAGFAITGCTLGDSGLDQDLDCDVDNVKSLVSGPSKDNMSFVWHCQSQESLFYFGIYENGSGFMKQITEDLYPIDDRLDWSQKACNRFRLEGPSFDYFVNVAFEKADQKVKLDFGLNPQCDSKTCLGSKPFTAVCARSDHDLDADTILDTEDNCSEAFNPDQNDQNQNGVGDACE